MAQIKPVVRLGEDEREMLLQLLSDQGWPILVHCLDQLVRRRGEDVLTIDDPVRLVKAKHEYNGSLSLLSDIKRLKDLLKLVGD